MSEVEKARDALADALPRRMGTLDMATAELIEALVRAILAETGPSPATGAENAQVRSEPLVAELVRALEEMREAVEDRRYSAEGVGLRLRAIWPHIDAALLKARAAGCVPC